MPSAERIMWAKWRVTITILVAMTILGMIVYLLSGTRLFVPKAMIRTYLSAADGLAGGSPVRLNGIGIGWVSRIGLSGLKDPAKAIEVHMIVDARCLASIPVDSTTQVASENALGDQYLEIDRGKSAVHIQRGGVLRHEAPSSLMSRIDLLTFGANLTAIDGLIQEIQQGKGAFGELIVGEKLYQGAIEKVTRLRTTLRTARTRGVLGRLISSDELYQSIRAPAVRLDAQLAALQAGRGAAGELLRSPKLYQDLNSKVDEVQRVIDRLEASPFIASDELYATWNGKLASLIRTVDELNAGRTSAGELLVNPRFYETLHGSLRRIGEDVRDFRLNPKKFLRVDLGLF